MKRNDIECPERSQVIKSKKGVAMRAYPVEIEQTMRKYYHTLNEKYRRRYAGIEAMKLGHGGIIYIAKVLECDRGIVSNAIKELKQLPEDASYDPQVRAKGGGRKPIEESCPHIEQAFLDVLKDYTAGDPQDEKLIWTNLTLQQIADKLEQEHSIKVSHTVVKKLLKKHRFKRRKAQKKRPSNRSRGGTNSLKT